MHSRVFEFTVGDLSLLDSRDDLHLESEESLYESLHAKYSGMDYVSEDADLHEDVKWLFSSVTGDSDVDQLKFSMLFHRKTFKKLRMTAYELKNIEIWISLMRTQLEEDFNKATKELQKLKRMLRRDEAIDFQCYAVCRSVEHSGSFYYVVNGDLFDEVEFYDWLLAAKAKNSEPIYLVKSWDYHC